VAGRPGLLEHRRGTPDQRERRRLPNQHEQCLPWTLHHRLQPWIRPHQASASLINEGEPKFIHGREKNFYWAVFFRLIA